jgi:catechol 2,3-dioxygenase-like lactoylglutathione lyase family enzyme
MHGIARFSLVAIDCPDPMALADFYGAITGWELDYADDDWAQLKSPNGVTIAFQRSPGHRPPRWPDDEHPQQMHLDFDVDDLDAGEIEVLMLGAVKTELQPAPDGFRVFIDPAGHPFCLVKA